MDEEEEKKKFETEENDGKGKKNTLDKEALCERLISKFDSSQSTSQSSVLPFDPQNLDLIWK